MAQDDIARLVAVLEADIRGFSKGMEKAQADFDKRAAAIERRQGTLNRRMTAGFGSATTGLNSLIGRYLRWAFVIAAAQRAMVTASETNEDAKTALDDLSKAWERMAQAASPTLTFITNGLTGILNLINDIGDQGQDAVGKLLGTKVRTSGIPFASAATPFATFDKKTGTWTPSAVGFPTPGVTDITPPKQTGNTFAERQAALDIETANEVAKAVDDIREQRFKDDQKYRAEQYEEAKRLRDSISAEELDALDQFHADAKEAWDRYYEAIADASDKADELEKQRVADRIAEVGDAFEYLGEAALRGGDIFKRALEDMVRSLAASGLRNLFEAGLRSLVSGGGFLGNLIAGTRASGGPVMGGSPYVVGEKGPELFVPKTSGTIIPNAMPPISGGGSVVLNMPIDARGAQQGVAEQIARVAPAIVEASVRRVAKSFPQMMIKAQRDSL